MWFLSPMFMWKGGERWGGSQGQLDRGSLCLELSTGGHRKWIKGKFKMIRLPFDPSAELLSAPGVGLCAKHHIQVKAALCWCPPG